jgi:ubiquinone/menaquinone biosynthesis C-methylase UbiE
MIMMGSYRELAPAVHGVAPHMASELQDYLADEWLIFARDPERRQRTLRAIGGLQVGRALDVGCGGGQDLIPFADSGSRAVGIDISPETAGWAHERFSRLLPALPVAFAAGAAESLPLASGSFDLVLCRVTIPYTDNRAAIREMARVLRPGGVLLLRTHRPRYYIRKFVDGIRQRSPRFSIHALRVLVSGLVYRLTGRQPTGGLLLRETFLTTAMLQRELEPAGLRIDAELEDSIPLAGSYRIRKIS